MPLMDSMRTRIDYYGGKKQDDRMIADKLRSLKQALLYSYQAETAVLADGREFRCLINPNKLSMELDDKMLSIPFEDIELSAAPGQETTTQGQQVIGVKVGDVIGWKETGTHWLVYSQYLQENAYFRGLMRQCDDEQVEFNGNKRWAYIKGPDEKTIDWTKTKHAIYNELNYTLEMYLPKDEETEGFFKRFAEITFKGKPWQVQAVDSYTTKGIVTVYLKEYYSNEFAATQPNEENTSPENPEASAAAQIIGKSQLHPYDRAEYTVVNPIVSGVWSCSNSKAVVLSQNMAAAQIEIVTGKSGEVDLIYRADGIEDIIYPIEILSLS